jgi:hypothetical protein
MQVEMLVVGFWQRGHTAEMRTHIAGSDVRRDKETQKVFCGKGVK